MAASNETVTPTVKPNKPQGCPTLTVAMTVKLNEPQGRPILTVTYTVKPNEPHGYSTLTVTMTVKLTEPQGCLTLTAIVAVKLRVCPLSRKCDFLPLSVPENKGCFPILRNGVSDLKKKEAWQKEICSPSNSLTDLDSKASRTYAQKIVCVSEKTKGVLQRNFDALNIALRSKFRCAQLLAFCD